MREVSPLLIALILFAPHQAAANTSRIPACSQESLCAAQSRMMQNITQPIGSEELQKSFQILKSCAAEHHPYAQFSLAYAYESGNGVARDTKQAFELYLKAANGGATPAMSMLTDYYSGAMGPELPANPSECYAWAEVATSLGDRFASRKSTFCGASSEQKTQGKTRAKEILKEIKEKLRGDLISGCR